MVSPQGTALSLKVSLITGLGALFALSPLGMPAGHAADALSSDVSVTQSGPVSISRPSQGVVSLTFTSVIRNSGPNAAKNVFLVAGPTTGGVYQNKRFIGCTSSDLLGRCNVGTIEPNTSKTVSVTYDLPAKTPCKTMNVAHGVLAWSQKTKDPTMVNNSAFVKTVVNCPVAVPPARLDIVVQAIGSMDTAVKNQKNINLLRFEARADTANNILMETLLFTAETGSLLNGQNYGLWVDTDGNAVVDTILQDGVWPANGTVSFSNLHGGGYVVPAGATVAFEVHADIASSLLSNNYLKLKFANPPSTYVTATDDSGNGNVLAGIATNGVCPSTCQIFVSTTPSTIWQLVNQGNLYVSKDTVSLRSRQLLGGTVGDAVLRVNLRADTEDIDVTLLSFVSGGSGRSVERLDLYRSGESTPFAYAITAACEPGIGGNVFCAVMQGQQLIVPKGQDIDVIVRPRIKSDENGGESGEKVQFELIKFIGQTDTAARGVISSNALTNDDGDGLPEGEIFIGKTSASANTHYIVGENNVAVMSKITSITNANPDANGSLIPIGSGRTLGQFRFTAAANMNTRNGQNKVAFSNIIFTVNATNVAFDKNAFKVYNKADPSVKAPCVVVDDTGSSPYYVACWDIPASGVNTDVDSNASVTLALETGITNPNVNPGSSSFQVSLDRFNDITLNGIASSLGHISWQDKDAATTGNHFYWIEYPENVINSTEYVR